MWHAVSASFLLAALTASCKRVPDLDRDGSPTGVDCDDSDPGRAVGLEEVVGDGVDQDCDGSDRPTRDLREVAAGRYASDLPGAQLGFTVACGPDRAGDGVGDLAALASEFGMNRILHAFAAALPGPVAGDHSVEEVLDLRVEPTRWSQFDDLLGLVDHAYGGGLFVGINNPHTNEPLFTAAGFVTESGPMDETTPAIVTDTGFNLEYALRPYAGPADLTGDGQFDYALGPVVFDRVPQGKLDLATAGRVALEADEEEALWAGTENAVGDLDHDGQDDLLFASSFPPVWLVFGPIGDTPAARDAPNTAQFWPEEADLPHSSNLDAVVGDVSGDGIDDLVIANMWYGQERGAVYVWFGPLEGGSHTTTTADVRFVGELDYGWTGRGLALGDFDGDGIQTLVVGASAYWLLVPGLVYVFDEPLVSGELTVDDTVAIYRGEEPGASTGRSIVACDTDRDGRDELVLGAHLVDWSPDVLDAGVFYWLDQIP